MTWLGDKIFSIRRAAAINLQKLSEQFGEDWAKDKILPKLIRMHEDKNYLNRMTSLYGIY
jgi:serine/threonine-protein phosphatase 2A regulatory subunit A